MIRRILPVMFLMVLGIRGVVALPMTLPVLSVDDYVAHARRLGIEPSTAERKELGILPQHYADMFGWREKVVAAREAFLGLHPGEREKACFFARNYGVAGALDNGVLVLGEERSPPLPPVISGHNNFWLWGPGECTGEVLIVMGGSAEELSAGFERVERVGTVRCAPCMPYEDEQAVFVARDPKRSIEQAWPRLKHYD